MRYDLRNGKEFLLRSYRTLLTDQTVLVLTSMRASVALDRRYIAHKYFIGRTILHRLGFAFASSSATIFILRKLPLSSDSISSCISSIGKLSKQFFWKFPALSTRLLTSSSIQKLAVWEQQFPLPLGSLATKKLHSFSVYPIVSSLFG